MEYEKNGEKFSFGFGTMKTAGSGDLTNAEEVPKSIKTKYDKKNIAKNAAKAAAMSALVILKHKRSKKKKK